MELRKEVLSFSLYSLFHARRRNPKGTASMYLDSTDSRVARLVRDSRWSVLTREKRRFPRMSDMIGSPYEMLGKLQTTSSVDWETYTAKCMPTGAICVGNGAFVIPKKIGRLKALGGELGSPRVLLLRHLVAVPTVS